MIQIILMESDQMSQLQNDVNVFLRSLEIGNVMDIKYTVSHTFTAEEQLDSYSACIVYCIASEKGETISVR